MTTSAKAKPDTAASFPKAGVSSMIDYLVALLHRKVADRESKDHDADPHRHLQSLRRDVPAHPATGLGVKATRTGHSVLFHTASNWISRLTDA
ncbi:hypothetical protein ACFCYH_16780 [Streptomyces sp. NPDC056400]|uniref:hypothetical protein n=1 Tax=Streptomyces sp. NPDC056400 TaxID=3345808 RepID=UPI0035D814C4